ncbi:hypothetical protein GDO78_013102 [Eleutherodactylus coqui]|uniref:Uncharacterized protein n=1 Tax=Eleutherodactylus coqui TaxID=57060 RepID=A0A8J6EZR5_ELECQ|nr:hypothetical protein GDO78_013102 [Eleutherodactylus coqui]
MIHTLLLEYVSRFKTHTTEGNTADSCTTMLGNIWRGMPGVFGLAGETESSRIAEKQNLGKTTEIPTRPKPQLLDHAPHSAMS